MLHNEQPETANVRPVTPRRRERRPMSRGMKIFLGFIGVVVIGTVIVLGFIALMALNQTNEMTPVKATRTPDNSFVGIVTEIRDNADAQAAETENDDTGEYIGTYECEITSGTLEVEPLDDGRGLTVPFDFWGRNDGTVTLIELEGQILVTVYSRNYGDEWQYTGEISEIPDNLDCRAVVSGNEPSPTPEGDEDDTRFAG